MEISSIDLITIHLTTLIIIHILTYSLHPIVMQISSIGLITICLTPLIIIHLLTYSLHPNVMQISSIVVVRHAYKDSTKRCSHSSSNT